MVFPTMFAGIDTGMVSQASIYAVVAFSYMLLRWKKIFILLSLIVMLGGVLNKAFAFAYVPGGCGTSCMANQNYYGNPYGGNGYYPYPGLPYHSFYGPAQYYFRPWGPSPYQPQYCVECMQRYQQFSAPMSFPGITQWEIPLEAPLIVNLDD